MARPKGKGSKRGALGKSDALQAIENSCYRCPKGHALPHKTNAGNCTPLHCAGKPPGTIAKEKQSQEKVRHTKDPRTRPKMGAKDAEMAALVGQEPPVALIAVTSERSQEETDYTERVSRAAGRHRARMSFLKVPENLEGAAAEEWADKELGNLLPEAVARLKFNLKYGDEDQSERAAQKVLDATGRGKKDAGGQTTAPIIMVMAPGGQGQLPWAKRIEVIDEKKQHGEVVGSKALKEG